MEEIRRRALFESFEVHNAFAKDKHDGGCEVQKLRAT
jgi:hypothetical protein